MPMLEKKLEQRLVGYVEAMGGQCLKWTSPGTTGLPDRIVLLPGGVIAFVEMKRPTGSRVSALQYYWRKVLTRLGFRHYFVHTQQQLEDVLTELKEVADCAHFFTL